MPHVLGIDLGARDTVVAVCPLDPTDPVEPRVLALRSSGAAPSGAVPSALDIGADGTVTCGSSVAGFVARVGDPAPVVVDGRRYPAHDLAAVLVACVLNRATALLGEQPRHTVLTHPAGWGPHRLGPLRRALHQQGLDALTLVPAPVAAAHAWAASAPVAVLDLAADPVEAVVVAPIGPAPGHRRFRRAGPVLTAEHPGGRSGGPGAVTGIGPAGREPWPRLVADALVGAGGAARPGAVVLTGASALLPEVARLVGRQLGCPVLDGPDPAYTVAVGAALAALTLVATPDVVAAATPRWARPPATDRPDGGPGHAVVRPEVGPRPPRPPVDIEPPDLDPPRSLVRSMAGRPLVLAGTGAVAAVGVALTLVLMPGGSGRPERPTPSPTSPPAAEVPQPLSPTGSGR